MLARGVQLVWAIALTQAARFGIGRAHTADTSLTCMDISQYACRPDQGEGATLSGKFRGPGPMNVLTKHWEADRVLDPALGEQCDALIPLALPE